MENNVDAHGGRRTYRKDTGYSYVLKQLREKHVQKRYTLFVKKASKEYGGNHLEEGQPEGKERKT